MDSKSAFFCLYTAMLFVFGFLSTMNIANGFQQRVKRIVGGEDAEIGEFPWHVSFHYDNGGGWPNHTCGGNILDATHVVGAAHCFTGKVIEKMLIVTGAHNISNPYEPNRQTIPVKSLRIHESFTATPTYDIVVIELESPIVFDEFSRPAPLCQEEPPAGTPLVIIGWGNAHPQGDVPPIYPQILQKVRVEAVGRSSCFQTYPKKLQEHMICAVGIVESPSGSCNKDSGSPYMYKPTGSDEYCVVALDSDGTNPCGFAPSIGASVPYFRNWIDESISYNEGDILVVRHSTTCIWILAVSIFQFFSLN